MLYEVITDGLRNREGGVLRRGANEHLRLLEDRLELSFLAADLLPAPLAESLPVGDPPMDSLQMLLGGQAPGQDAPGQFLGTFTEGSYNFV